MKLLKKLGFGGLSAAELSRKLAAEEAKSAAAGNEISSLRRRLDASYKELEILRQMRADLVADRLNLESEASELRGLLKGCGPLHSSVREGLRQLASSEMREDGTFDIDHNAVGWAIERSREWEKVLSREPHADTADHTLVATANEESDVFNFADFLDTPGCSR